MKISSGGRHLQSVYGHPPVKTAEDVPLQMTFILIVAPQSLLNTYLLNSSIYSEKTNSRLRRWPVTSDKTP